MASSEAAGATESATDLVGRQRGLYRALHSAGEPGAGHIAGGVEAPCRSAGGACGEPGADHRCGGVEYPHCGEGGACSEPGAAHRCGGVEYAAASPPATDRLSHGEGARTFMACLQCEKCVWCALPITQVQ